MTFNILITGAAGYIAGTLVHEIATGTQSMVNKDQIIAAVRTEEQEQKLSALGVKVARFDLSNEEAAIQAILDHDISLVVNFANCFDATLAKPLITGLNKRSQASGKPGSFIHTSGASEFADKSGWNLGPVKDTDPVPDLVKQIETPYAIRQTDIAILEYALESNVTTYMVVPALVYGLGRGAGNQMSLILPFAVRACIANKAVYKFSTPQEWSAVQVDDLADFYLRFIQAVAQGKPLPSGRDGYFFPTAHQVRWWDTLDRLAAALYARQLITDATVREWPSAELAAETLGMPIEYAQLAFNSTSVCTSEKMHLLGWEPSWDESRYLKEIDGEIAAVLDPSVTSKTLALPKEVPHSD